MKKKILPLLLFFVAAHITHAVSRDEPHAVVVDTEEPDPDTYLSLVENYPSFTVEFLRMDYLYNKGSKQSIPFHRMKKIDWRSLLRGNNVALLYAIRIKHSRFALCPGIGWSTLHYAFRGENVGGETRYLTLKRKLQSQTVCEDHEDEQGKTLLRSAVEVPFFDVLLRLRFNSVLDAPKEGFHAWLGVKFGLRHRASTIIDYKEYNDPGASSVCKGHFNLNPYALGLQAGIGYHRLGLVGGFQLTPLFEKEKGPSHSDMLRPFSFSMYVDLV